MSYNDPIKKVLKDQNTSEKGLTTAEANERLKKHGPNSIVSKKKFKLLKLLIAQFTDLLAVILIVAGFLSIIFGETRDAYIIFGIVLLNALIGFMQEFKAERAIQALKKMVPQKAIVLRDGKEVEVLASDLVTGDIVILDEGDSVPADIRLIEANEFYTNDVVLTGESEPQQKTITEINKTGISLSEIDNTVFMGMTVVTGNAIGVVVGTGMETEFGRIAHLTQTIKENVTPLQKEVKKMAKEITLITLAIVLLIFGLGVLLDQTLFESFGFSLGVASSTVPEGLAATISIALAVGVQRMARSNTIIKKLSSVESLGSTTVIVTDKTGTLTKNEMTVKEIWANGASIHVEGVGNMPVGQFLAEGTSYDVTKIDKLFKAAIFCNEAGLEQERDNCFKILGDQTEGALLVMAEKAGLDTKETRSRANIIYEIPFNSERKKMTVVSEVNKQVNVFMKGAVTEVLKNCTQIEIEGRVRKLTEKDRKEILKRNDILASDALRVLGFATKEVSKKKKYEITEIENDLIFVGMVGMIDPPKSEVKEAVELCKKAGIRVIMVTGDYQVTAIAIGKRIGLFEQEPNVVTGQDLNKLSETELKKILKKDVIFARVDPVHKMRIVSALQDLDEIVAVTGDGVNDAPALKKADVGVAMGITGTDVSKESAEMIVTDDNFSSIVRAVKEGRVVYENLKKFVLYILSSNSTEFFTVMTGFLLGVHPILAIQILFVDLGTDVMPSMALAIDKGDNSVMEKKPRSRKEKLLNKKVLRFLLEIGIFVSIMAALAFLAVMILGGEGLSEESQVYAKATTVVYSILVVCQLVNSFHCRGVKDGIFWTIFGNGKLLFANIFSIILLLLVIYNESFQSLFQTDSLGLFEWGLVIGAAILFKLFLNFRKL